MVEPFVRAEWSPVPREGCVGVEGRVLGQSGSAFLAMLRFDERATIDEHSATFDIDVFCLEGSGRASVAGAVHDLHVGERLRWPAGSMHRLWTEGTTMTALMVEHHGAG
jgi:quercetin dioxygenase-like cupin family protein